MKEKELVRRQHEEDMPSSPLRSLRREMNRMFEDFFHDWNLPSWMRPERPERFLPSVDIDESDKEIRVTAELPGLSDKDVEVLVEGNELILRGQKSQEEKHEHERYYRVERSYGSFRRVIPLPEEVLADQTRAEFHNGVLTVTLPKNPEAAPHRRRIEVKPV